MVDGTYLEVWSCLCDAESRSLRRAALGWKHERENITRLHNTIRAISFCMRYNTCIVASALGCVFFEFKHLRFNLFQSSKLHTPKSLPFQPLAHYSFLDHVHTSVACATIHFTSSSHTVSMGYSFTIESFSSILRIWAVLVVLFQGPIVVAADRRSHFEYVPIQRVPELTDLHMAKDLCVSLCQGISRAWNTKKGLGNKDHLRRPELAQNTRPSATSVSTSKHFALERRGGRETQSLSWMDKTKHAALATKTAATKIASKILSSPSTAEESAELMEQMIQQPHLEFAHFSKSQNVETVMVSRNQKENLLLLARLKSKKRRRKQQSTVAPDKPTLDGQGSSSETLDSLTDPLIPQKVWSQLTGKEFIEHPELLERLAKMGHTLATRDESNEWIAWSQVGSSFKESLDDGGIHVWTGQTKREKGDQVFYGAAAPFIKTRSIVPMSPVELIDLMLDSSRVKIYNKFSTGRFDLWKSEDERTKIVQNTNNVPMQKKPLRSTTLLHACPVAGKADAESSWLLLSRAVGPQPEDKDLGTSDILLGVNLLEPIGDDKCRLTAITHVYSSAVPGMLAERLGVKSAINFVNDLRAVSTATPTPE